MVSGSGSTHVLSCEPPTADILFSCGVLFSPSVPHLFCCLEARCVCVCVCVVCLCVWCVCVCGVSVCVCVCVCAWGADIVPCDIGLRFNPYLHKEGVCRRSWSQLTDRITDTELGGPITVQILGQRANHSPDTRTEGQSQS